jgi:hypothetical protein
LQGKNQLGKLVIGGVNILFTNVKSVINSHFFLFYNIYHIYFFSPMEQNIYTILITLITVLTSTAAWKFYERKLSMKAMKEKGEQRDSEMFRDDLRERVVKLETLLQESAKEKAIIAKMQSSMPKAQKKAEKAVAKSIKKNK